MLKISYKHTVNKDGTVVLSDYRYADDTTEKTMCKMVGGSLVWYEEPDEFTRAVVENEFEKVQRNWFLEYYGIKKIFTKLSDLSLEEQMKRETGWL